MPPKIQTTTMTFHPAQRSMPLNKYNNYYIYAQNYIPTSIRDIKHRNQLLKELYDPNGVRLTPDTKIVTGLPPIPFLISEKDYEADKAANNFVELFCRRMPFNATQISVITIKDFAGRGSTVISTNQNIDAFKSRFNSAFSSADSFGKLFQKNYIDQFGEQKYHEYLNACSQREEGYIDVWWICDSSKTEIPFSDFGEKIRYAYSITEKYAIIKPTDEDQLYFYDENRPISYLMFGTVDDAYTCYKICNDKFKQLRDSSGNDPQLARRILRLMCIIINPEFEQSTTLSKTPFSDIRREETISFDDACSYLETLTLYNPTVSLCAFYVFNRLVDSVTKYCQDYFDNINIVRQAYIDTFLNTQTSMPSREQIVTYLTTVLELFQKAWYLTKEFTTENSSETSIRFRSLLLSYGHIPTLQNIFKNSTDEWWYFDEQKRNVIQLNLAEDIVNKCFLDTPINDEFSPTEIDSNFNDDEFLSLKP